MATTEVKINMDGTTIMVVLKNKHDRDLWKQLKGRIMSLVGDPEFDDLTVITKNLGEGPRVQL